MNKQSSRQQGPSLVLTINGGSSSIKFVLSKTKKMLSFALSFRSGEMKEIQENNSMLSPSIKRCSIQT
jgi:acetate kinase